MIFVTVGHCVPFNRLINRMDKLASELDEPVIQQIGGAREPVNCESFRYKDDLFPYYRQARLIIAHAGMGTALEIVKMGKPLILVPRQHRFNEHFDDHQIETCEKLQKSFNLLYITDINELTADLLKSYSFVAQWDDSPLRDFRKNIMPILLSS